MIQKFASCDTFVVVKADEVIFGKNSDRPRNEVQEIVYQPAQTHEANSKLKCTYIEIDQAETTYAIVLSKPSWMHFGAESGSNEYGVAVGNEAIEPGLLGQGGLCAELGSGYDGLAYENSFLIADQTEAWVVETVGKEWAAEKVDKMRNISNCLTITTKIDKESKELRNFALNKNLWNGRDEFNFMKIFQSKFGEDRSRFECGKKYLDQFASGEKHFDIFSMMEILRDEKSDICRGIENSFPTQGSQISVLSKKRQVHWFTGTPDPNHSVFKPFVFNKDIKLTKLISEPVNKEKSWKHLLYLKHEAAYPQLIRKENSLNKTLREVERGCVEEIQNSDLSNEQLLELNELFNDSVDAELRFYK